MSQNGKDTSGNALKYSLIPLFIGIAVIFFLYRACGNSTYEPQPKSSTTPTVVEDKASLDTLNDADSLEVKEDAAA